MSDLVRFGVAIDAGTFKRFEAERKKSRYTNRSEAIRDLMRAEFVRDDWESSTQNVVAVISIVYDHHRRGLVNKLLKIQHHHPAKILCSQHVHLSHERCLEVIVAQGEAKKIKELADRLKVEKGVSYTSLNSAGRL